MSTANPPVATGDHPEEQGYYQKDNVAVSLSFINEGFDGDYDPENPEDEPLLRFCVYVMAKPEQAEEHWDRVSDYADENDRFAYTSSHFGYCTFVPATITQEQKQKMMEHIWTEVSPHVYDGLMPSICDRLSGLDMHLFS